MDGLTYEDCLEAARIEYQDILYRMDDDRVEEYQDGTDY